MLASESFANIKRANVTDDELSIDAALLSGGGRYNWMTDKFS